MSGPLPDGVARAVEKAARLSYGRLVAFLAREWGNIASAEDALAEAFRSALESWPRTGLPANPDGWLLTAARNRLLDVARSGKVRADAASTVALLSETEEGAATLPDRRLALLFVCAHPVVDEAAQTPLMLQTVLGLDAARIASVFLVKPATMGQRLSRAKARIAEAGVRFALPEPEDFEPRAEAVREAIYGAYTAGWDDIAGLDPRRRGLTEEAIWLARVLVAALPEDAESRGLLALMLHCEARAPARRTAAGDYVPLGEQDPHRWSRDLVIEAESELTRAARLGRPGRFQIEAAIQSALAQGVMTGVSTAPAILKLSEILIAFAPTIGNRLGHAAALADVEGPAAALVRLESLPADLIANHQPFHALRGDLRLRLGDRDGARSDLLRAAGLTDDPAVSTFLRRKAETAR